MIDVSKLSEEQRAVAELIGLENYELLVDEYGGQIIYVPAARRLKRTELAAALKRQYNGDNAEMLGKKYRISAKTVMRIIME